MNQPLTVSLDLWLWLPTWSLLQYAFTRVFSHRAWRSRGETRPRLAPFSPRHTASLAGQAPLTWWQLGALPAHGVGHSFEYSLLI